MNPIDNDDKFCIGVVFLILLMYLLFCTGCAAKREEQAQTNTVRQETTVIDCSVPFPVAAADGMHMIDIPLHLVMKRDSTQVAKTDATRTSTIEIPEIGTAVRAAIAQFAPGLSSFISAPAAPDHTGAIIGGVTALSAILGAIAKARADAKRIDDAQAEIEHHKADAKEGWDLAEKRLKPGTA